MLDYRKADRWSISLIVLDILFGRIGLANPFYPRRSGRILDQNDYEDDDVHHLFSPEYYSNPIFPSFNPVKYNPELIKWQVFPELLALLSKDPCNRPDLRSPLNKLYFTAFDAPSFSSNR